MLMMCEILISYVDGRPHEFF